MLDPLVAALRKYWAGKWRCTLGFHQTLWEDELQNAARANGRWWLIQFGQCGKCGVVRFRWVAPAVVVKTGLLENIYKAASEVKYK